MQKAQILRTKSSSTTPKRGPGRVLTVSRGAAVGYSVTLSSVFPLLPPSVRQSRLPRIFTRPLSLMLSVVVMMHPLHSSSPPPAPPCRTCYICLPSQNKSAPRKTAVPVPKRITAVEPSAGGRPLRRRRSPTPKHSPSDTNRKLFHVKYFNFKTTPKATRRNLNPRHEAQL